MPSSFKYGSFSTTPENVPLWRTFDVFEAVSPRTLHL